MGESRAPSWLTRGAAASLGAAACAVGLSLAATPHAWAAPADSPASPESDPAPGRAGSAPGSPGPRTATRADSPRPPAGTARRTGSAENTGNAVPPREPRERRSALALPAAAERTGPVRVPGASTSAAGTPVAPGATSATSPAPPAIVPAPALPPAPVAKAVAPGSGNPIVDFINGIVLAIQTLVSNRAPTAAPVQAMTRPNGQIWGFVAGSDPDGDPLTYTLNQKPRFGTVTVSPNGVYSYSPGADFTGTDTFTVTVADPGTPFALLNFLSGHTRNVTVSVKTSTGTAAGAVVDTFDGPAGSAPDPALWGYHVGALRDDGLQTYTDSPDNVRLDGQGNLVIQARNTPEGYTSTRLVTQDRLEMQYGTVEARIKMPAGQGIWPSFWMLGTSYYPEFWERWPECGEIDIMEVVNTGTQYTVALHGPQGATDYYGGATSGRFVGNQGPISAVAPIQDLTADFHDYWLMWREDQIVIGVDNTMLGEFTPASLPPGGEWVFNQPMYGILQIAVGGPWPGPPDATTPWPATMLVDRFSYTPLP